MGGGTYRLTTAHGYAGVYRRVRAPSVRVVAPVHAALSSCLMQDLGDLLHEVVPFYAAWATGKDSEDDVVAVYKKSRGAKGLMSASDGCKGRCQRTCHPTAHTQIPTQ